MFNLFKKKDPKAVLRKKYRDLLEEAHRLSTVNRAQSDIKRAEAEEVLMELERMERGMTS